MESDGTWSSQSDDDEAHVFCVRHLISSFKFKPIVQPTQVFHEISHEGETHSLAEAKCNEIRNFSLLSFDQPNESLDFVMSHRLSGIFFLDDATTYMSTKSRRTEFKKKWDAVNSSDCMQVKATHRVEIYQPIQQRSTVRCTRLVGCYDK